MTNCFWMSVSYVGISAVRLCSLTEGYFWFFFGPDRDPSLSLLDPRWKELEVLVRVYARPFFGWERPTLFNKLSVLLPLWMPLFGSMAAHEQTFISASLPPFSSQKCLSS